MGQSSVHSCTLFLAQPGKWVEKNRPLRSTDIKAMVTAPDGNIYSTPYVQEGEDGTIASNIMSSKIPRSAGHQAKFERNRDYYLPYATSIYLPSMILSEEDTDALSLIKQDIQSYTEEMRAKWLSQGGVDEEWDDYVTRLNGMGLDEYMEIYQRNYSATH